MPDHISDIPWALNPNRRRQAYSFTTGATLLSYWMDFSIFWEQCSNNRHANSYLTCPLGISSPYKTSYILIENRLFYVHQLNDFSMYCAHCSTDSHENSYLRCLSSIPSPYKKYSIFIHKRRYFTDGNEWIFQCSEHTVQLIQVHSHIWVVHWGFNPPTRSNTNPSIKGTTSLMLMNWLLFWAHCATYPHASSYWWSSLHLPTRSHQYSSIRGTTFLMIMNGFFCVLRTLFK
jgi:hypothetical protein